MLSSADATWLLDELCARLGFCLPSVERQRLQTAPPCDPEAFTEAVFHAEGLDVETADRQLYRQVRSLVTEAFRQHDHDEPMI